MDLLSANICQLAGLGVGAAAVAALAALSDCNPARADCEELALARDEALSAADSQGSYAGGNLKGVIVLGNASEGNTGGLVSALKGVGILASIAGEAQIRIDLSSHLKDADTSAENVMYEELVSCGLVLSPAKQVGVYHALRAHYDTATMEEIVRRFESFLGRRERGETKKEEASVDLGETNEVVEGDVEVEMNLQSLATPLPKASTARRATKTKTTTTAKTTGRGRKRKPADDADSDETDSTPAEAITAAIVSAASVMKTPSARRRSVAAEISEEVTSTVRKSRRRTLD